MVKARWVPFVLGGIALCCLGLAAYSNSFHSPFQYDDLAFTARDQVIRERTLDNIRYIGWKSRTIYRLTLALNYRLGGLDVFGYRVFNAALHVGSSLLVWWLALLTFNTPVMRREALAAYKGPIALLAGAFFLLHPVQTGAVNMIHQRSALLVSFFYIAALACYAAGRISRQEGSRRIVSAAWYCGALLAAFMSLFSKEIWVTLPLSVLLYEWTFLKRERIPVAQGLVPLAAIIIAGAIMAFLFVKYTGQTLDAMFRIGGVTVSPWRYFLTQLNVKVTYLRLVLLPVNLNIDYDYPVARSFFQAPVIINTAMLSLILASAIALFRRYRILSFGVFWFFITLLPESGIIPLHDVIVEHRLYLPLAGLSISLVAAVFCLFGEKRRRYAAVALALLIGCYGVMTYERNRVWQSEFALWDDAVRKSPRKARAYMHRGNAYARRGDSGRAMEDYDRAIRLLPKYADAYYNRALLFIGTGERDRALSDLNRSIELDSRFAAAYINRGNVYFNSGNVDLAISDYNAAIALGGDLEAFNNIAVAYFQKREYDKAWMAVQWAQFKGYAVDPEFIEKLKKASGRL